ncbi:MAG: DUF4392 domain-containing protein [Gemmataceae bacterium]|nr:DUF4392 domain-containing protein [Gemmataceae bacterium]
MTPDEQLAAILAAIQTDPGNRGLAELFCYCPGDFAAACRGIADHPAAGLDLLTGFFIPTATPPAFETDGPLGAVFLYRAFRPLAIPVVVGADAACSAAVRVGLAAAGAAATHTFDWCWADDHAITYVADRPLDDSPRASHVVALERAGPAADGRLYTMRGRDITRLMEPVHRIFSGAVPLAPTIAIGDGGNEIGMGKIPHEQVVKNIPNGDLIHCCIPTDHLIVAGVSNWGAYALAAGVYVLRGTTPPAGLFDPDRERAILEVMVRDGPLVDGVTGRQTATVDGLRWDEYVKPLVRIREILGM